MRCSALGAVVLGIAGCGSDGVPPCDGCLIVEDLPDHTWIAGLAADHEGRLVAAVASNLAGHRSFVARLDRSGVLEPSFGAGGVLTFVPPSSPDGYEYPFLANPFAIVVMSDGAIRIGGKPERSNATNVLGATPDGREDGFVISEHPHSGTAVSLMNQDGSLVIGYGTIFDSGGFVERLVRFTPAGTLDPSFGVIPSESAVAIAPDGGFFMGGVLASSLPEHLPFVVRRVTRDGQPDLRFGSGVRIILPAVDAVPARSGVAVAPSTAAPGGMLIAGVGLEDGKHGLYVARLDATGQLDPRFGGRGFVLHDVIGAGDVHAVAEMPDGRIVVVGTAGERTLSFGSFAAATRLLADGSLDPTFGEGGVAITSTDVSFFRTVVVLPDGDIVAAGVAVEHPISSTYFVTPRPLFARFPAGAHQQASR